MMRRLVMPFQVKATVVDFLGNQKIYPCHMMHRVGDVVIFDGESYIGRLCPDVWPLIAPKVAALHTAGPRYFEWGAYYPFWYCSVSEEDPGQKKYDGLGFKNVLKTIIPPKYDMATLVDPKAFTWPPYGERTLVREPTVICPDTRTSMLMKLEAFDLSERGFDVPYFRRQMAILSKLQLKNGIEADKILSAFSKKQIEEIYPPLSAIMVQALVEELEVMGYAKTQKGVTSITDTGRDKLRKFKAALPGEDREAFAQYEK
jgi:uncharacterized repeat protein (TIGR04076 family)